MLKTNFNYKFVNLRVYHNLQYLKSDHPFDFGNNYVSRLSAEQLVTIHRFLVRLIYMIYKKRPGADFWTPCRLCSRVYTFMTSGVIKLRWYCLSEVSF